MQRLRGPGTVGGRLLRGGMCLALLLVGVLVDLAVGRSEAASFAGEAGLPAEAVFPGEASEWHGFARHDFRVAGRASIVVRPETVAPGKPWIWRARFFGHEPQADIALLRSGYHLVYCDVGGLFGSPRAVDHWDAFYRYLTGYHGFARRAAIEAMSRGGLIAFNFAARYPERVSCIYADAPVCDFKSWPGGVGAADRRNAEWEQCLRSYGLDEVRALAYRGNPIDHLEPLAEHEIPLLHVIGAADPVVPPAENTDIIERRYRALGGSIEVISKAGGGHHPHSLRDPSPIVEFVKRNTDRPPNIVLFLVDDMGWQDTSVPFTAEPTPWNRLYRTPHMEDLARRGMKFTQAYSAHPVCSPTRTSMMTGKNPARTHIDDWVGHGQSQNKYLRSPKWAATGLQPGDDHRLLPDLLRDRGYRTIHVGKAHFGGQGTPGADPTTLGFDINVAGTHSGGPWGGWISPWLGKYSAYYPGLEGRPEGEYLTDAITVRALEEMDAAIETQVPFFVNMAQFAVHAKIAPAPKYIDGYQDGRPKVEADYASMLEAMDASLGAILEKLRDPNGDGDRADSVAEETLVLFMSDNGGLSNHSRARVGEIELPDGVHADFERDYHNRPLKSGKGSAYEGGIRVPMIVAWAGQDPRSTPVSDELPIRPGTTCAEPVHMDDFFPTILDVAGANAEVGLGDDRDADGQSLTPLLAGRSFRREKGLFWHYPHQWYQDIGVGLGIEPFSAVRLGDYKLIYFYGDGEKDGEGYDPRTELYHLGHDIGETTDLTEVEPERARSMREHLSEWLRRLGAGIPIVKATGGSAALPSAQP